jgi:hypothetical protein
MGLFSAGSVFAFNYIQNEFMKNLAWVLLVIGVVMLVVRGINYTTKEKVVDLGPVEINKTENHRVDWPIYAGGILALAGVLLLVTAKKE